MKGEAASALPGAMKIAERSREQLALISTGMNYIFPFNPEVRRLASWLCSETDLCRRRTSLTRPSHTAASALPSSCRPCSSSQVSTPNVGLKHLDKLKSSLPTAPNELEVPVTMVALAATAVSQILLFRYLLCDCCLIMMLSHRWTLS